MSDMGSATDREVCGEELEVLRCDLPAGHSGDFHHAGLALPPDAARLVDAALTDLELERTRYRRARRWGWTMFWLWGASVGVYLWLILSHATGGQ